VTVGSWIALAAVARLLVLAVSGRFSAPGPDRGRAVWSAALWGAVLFYMVAGAGVLS